ncbi:MAG TPA: hypothetical protein V6D13_11150 [Halomicronema sp.]
MIQASAKQPEQVNNCFKIFPYDQEYSELWDKFVSEVPMATFLHTRRYLSYHADKFKDISLIITDDKNQWIGLFLAAVDPDHSYRVISHPGITYGGVLHKGNLFGEKMLQALQSVRNYYAATGFEVLIYKAIPYIYHQKPSADDLHALFRLGATRYRCDLSCAIDLQNSYQISQRRSRCLKKAQKQNVQVKEGATFAQNLWPVIEENLNQKYGVKPVHTLYEILHLYSLFPDNIQFVVGVFEAQIVAGVVLFNSLQVMHAQYIAASPAGYNVSALDAIFDYCLKKANLQNKRYFNFGVSTEDQGYYLNVSLYQFKAEFGGGGVLHEFYELKLKG